jgi:sarcosine oxidase
MGAATAWQLASRGHSVALIEQFGVAHDKGSSHGAVRIFRFAYRNPLYTKLALEALPLWRELEAESNENLLSQIGNIDHGVPGAIREIERSLKNADRECTLMSQKEASDRWPGMKFETEVLFSSDGGVVQADGSIRAMYRRFEELGGRVFTNTRVEDIEINGDIATIATAEGTFRTKSVVVAAGAWVGKLVGEKIQLPKLVVELGQPTHFAPLPGFEDPTLWPAFIHHANEDDSISSVSGGAYGMFTPGVGVKVGFEEQGHYTDPDNRNFDIISTWNENTKNYVREWFPGVDPESADPVTCLFTNTPDSDFIIDRQGPLTVVSACSGHGFKFTPRIGQIAADLACGSTQHVKEWRFRSV